IGLLIEITKALRHHDRYVIGAKIERKVADIRLTVTRAIGKLACFGNCSRITIDARNRGTTAAKGACMSPHPAADIEKFAETGQRCAGADKVDLLRCARFRNAELKEFEPALRV